MDMENTRQSSIGQRAAKRGTQGGKFAFFAVLGLASLTAVATLSGRVSPVAAGTDTSDTASSTNYDFSHETEVNPKELSAVISSSARTDDSQSLSVTFSSLRTETLANGTAMKNVYVVADDDAFPGTFADAIAAAKEEKAAKKEAGEEYTPAHYNAQVFTVFNTGGDDASRTNVVIPSSLSYGTYFVFDVTSIGANANIDASGNAGYSNISSITIPSTIRTIDANAFAQVPNELPIRCEAPAGTYGNEWTDAENLTYGYQLTASEKGKLNVKSSQTLGFGEGEFFILGIKRGTEYNYPLTLEYKTETINSDGSTTLDEGDAKFYEAAITSQNADYDAVQSGTTSFEFAIPVEKGHQLSASSLRFHNIYRAHRDGDAIVPNLAEGGFSSRPRIRFTKAFHIDEFISRKTRSVSTLGSYTQISVNIDRAKTKETPHGLYSLLNPSVYNANKSKIESGEFKIRYQFSSLPQAFYRVICKTSEGTVKSKDISLDTPITNVLLKKENDNHIGFLFKGSDVSKDYSFDMLVDVQLVNFILKIDLYDSAKHSIVTKSAVSTRFSAMSLIDDIESVRRIDVSVVMTVTYLVYSLVFIVGAVGYYFYSKNKYKNDEFRRVVTKKYVKTATKNFVGFALVLSSILFIVSRWGLLKSSVVVFNPLDVYVILFTIAGGIFLGFAIKNLVTNIKNAKKRREAIRLKLDQDVADDGTK